MSLKTETAADSGDGFSAPEPLGNQGSDEPKIDLADNARELAFEEVNAVTWKLTDGAGTNQWSGYRGVNHRTTRAIAHLIGVGGGFWIVRYRDRASKPMKLNVAKKYAIEMVRGIRSGVEVEDHIGRLNELSVGVADAANEWLPPVEPDLVEYIRHVEVDIEQLEVDNG